MAVWHDFAARAIRLAERAHRAPAGDAIVADTEAGPVRLWIYRGVGTGDDAPVYIHFPDTAFIMPTSRDDEEFPRAVADALDAVVLLVDVPRAPRQRFPVAPTQAQAVAWWAMMAGRKQGWNGKRLALGGVGTGANLALGACLELPARMGVKPAGVVALKPVLDMSRATGGRERAAQAAYLPDAAARVAPLASPLFAPADSLAAFAPSFLAATETDPRRDEGETFAAMLRNAGRDARLVTVPRPDAAFDEAAAFLRGVFTTSG